MDWAQTREKLIECGISQELLPEKFEIGINLTRANLTRADLRGADLTEANLTGADLTRANLYGADLREANLTGANLTGADLTLYDYIATAITADATVDQQELAAYWTLWSLSWHDILTTALTTAGSIGKLLVDNINATIGSRATQADILSDATPFPGASIDAAISTRGTADPGDAMDLTAGALGDIDTELSATHGAGSWEFTPGTVFAVGPVIVGGDVRVIRGDSYLNVDGRRLQWSSSSWSVALTSTIVVIIQDIENFTGTRLSATSIGLELTTAQTTALTEGNFLFSVQEVKNTGQRITRVQGNWETAIQPIPLT